MSLILKLADHVSQVSFADLPVEEIHQLKRLIIDSLGCIYGANDVVSVNILHAGLSAIDDSTREASLFRSDLPPTSMLNAILVNGAMLRYLDLNDVQNSAAAPGNGHGHNSELLPPALAVAERERLSGRDLLLALWIGYEVSTRFTEAIKLAGPTLEKRGWNHDLRASLVVPVLIGRLLGLGSDAIAYGAGAAFSRGMVLGVVDHPEEASSMAKNLRFPWGAHLGTTAAYLAREGFTAPHQVLEGGGGFIDTVLDGSFDSQHLLNAEWGGRALQASIKQHAACFAEAGHLAATEILVREHDIQPDDVVSIHIETTTRGATHTGDPSRRHPPDKETADHSSYFTTAAVVVDRELGPAQYTPEKLRDPRIARIADLVTIEGAEEYDSLYPSSTVTIELADGQRVVQYVGQPPGSWQNPLTDDAVEAKFRALVRGRLTDEKADRWLEAVWDLERFTEIGEFMTLTRA